MAATAPVAIITGGASGIGLAVVERLIYLGWNVTIVDFNTTAGSKIAERLGNQALFIKTNVALYKEQVEAFSQTYNRWGRVDFVYANAGIMDRADFCRPQTDDQHGAPPQPDTLVIDVDLLGIVWSSYLALHYFRKNASKAGKLAMTSSSAGIYAISEVPLYAAAKHGVIGLARSLGKRMMEQNEPITVNAIIPGLVPTSILSPELVEGVPERFRTPASLIVRAIERIISDSSITGQAVECSGEEIVFRPPLPNVNEASEYTAGGKYRESLDANPVMNFGEAKGKALDGMSAK